MKDSEILLIRTSLKLIWNSQAKKKFAKLNKLDEHQIMFDIKIEPKMYSKVAC